MIETGQCICHICGKTFSRAYYHNASNADGVILLRRGGRYAVEPARSGNHDPSILGKDEYRLSSDNDYEDGLPNRIEVMKNGVSVRMFHCCPECGVHTNLFSNSGVAPTYSIAIVGGNNSGKTAWLKALGVASNRELLQRAHYPYQIELESTPESGDTITTNADGEGATRYLTIEPNDGASKGRNICAGVLLRDFGGELFNETLNETLSNANLDRLLQQRSTGGPDAYLLFLDGSEANQNNFINAWRTLEKNYFSPRRKPIVGVVITHVDKMVGQQTPALLIKDTFRPGESYQVDALTRRMDLEDLIARKYSGQISVIRSVCAATRGFIVKSCLDVTKDYAQYVNEGINVYDPLLWILNQLEIFPWR